MAGLDSAATIKDVGQDPARLQAARGGLVIDGQHERRGAMRILSGGLAAHTTERSSATAGQIRKRVVAGDCLLRQYHLKTRAQILADSRLDSGALLTACRPGRASASRRTGRPRQSGRIFQKLEQVCSLNGAQ